MSFGKDDFLNWDGNKDLGSLLGEYTCNELELTNDGEQAKEMQKTKTEKSTCNGFQGRQKGLFAYATNVTL